MANTWRIITVRQGGEDKYLEDGWEPFAVFPEIHTCHPMDSVTWKNSLEISSEAIIYLRKKQSVKG